MQFEKQYAGDAFRRVQTHLDDSAPEVQGFKGTDGRKQLDAVVDSLDQNATEQTSLGLQIKGASEAQLKLETELRDEHLEPIADFARGKLRGKPDYATLGQPVSQLYGKRLVLHAHAVAKAAVPYLADFTGGGFPQDTLVQLSSMADQLEKALDDRANLKVRRAGATQAMEDETQRGKDAVRMLNGLVRKQYAKNAPFLASWRAARRIVLKPGFPRGSKNAATPAAPPQATQPAAAVVTPAPSTAAPAAVTLGTTPVQSSKAV